ncbi:3-oxoacyl-[acyl-carrier protein] reductase [Paucimonas lemoignei]|uniref:3-oxoacyl-[acyl-carrier protein] reductase n=1 Tax=Paucimonas lemoignei TaxID=29443 RepID=A0A4R3HSS1_PAULE|nr:SDR family oxidoreductase [Paucimonas lemoignei]TCS34050.1 3-oxoacyl-[acyl-carrier protein] reductase [Paucimonas lemoignei]
MSDLMGIAMHAQRVAIVGVGGIGEPCAEICAQLGAKLILADRVAPQAIAERIAAQHGAQTEIHALDIGSVESVNRFCADIGDIDALIVTAAILPEERELEPGSDEWEASFQRAFDINLRGPMQLAQIMMQKMIAKKAGRIVLLGSLAGRSGGLLSGAQYASGKGAIHTLVRWLALRAASHGVCVNGLAPGATATPMLTNEVVDTRKIPAGRLAQPIEIARVAAFLASPAASYMHGAVVDVNGGACFS